MAITPVQRAKGTSSTAVTTISLPSAPTSGSLIVLRFSSDDYNGTPDTGWTQSTGMEQQTWHGSYLWWQVSNGTNSFQYTIGSATGSSWILEEWSGLDGTAPYDVSNGTFTQASGSTQATPAITPTAGDRLLLASMGGSFSGDLTAVTGSFDSSFTADAYQGNSGHATDDWVMAGHRLVTADGATAYSTTGTASINLQTRSGLIIAFKAAAGGGGAVTGTLAATESGSDTASASGSVAASGSLSATETGSDTASASGSVTASGSLAATEAGSDTASASGTVAASGTLAATESGSDTASGSGTVEASGSMAAAEAGADTANVSGSVTPAGVSGLLSATETGLDTASGTGSVEAPPDTGPLVDTHDGGWAPRKPIVRDYKKRVEDRENLERDLRKAFGLIEEVEGELPSEVVEAVAEVLGSPEGILPPASGIDWAALSHDLQAIALMREAQELAQQIAQENAIREQEDDDFLLLAAI